MGNLRPYRRSIARFRGIPWESTQRRRRPKAKAKMGPTQPRVKTRRPAATSWSRRNIPTFRRMFRKLTSKRGG